MQCPYCEDKVAVSDFKAHEMKHCVKQLEKDEKRIEELDKIKERLLSELKEKQIVITEEDRMKQQTEWDFKMLQ